jgi:hypothetical protein
MAARSPIDWNKAAQPNTDEAHLFLERNALQAKASGPLDRGAGVARPWQRDLARQCLEICEA